MGISSKNIIPYSLWTIQPLFEDPSKNKGKYIFYDRTTVAYVIWFFYNLMTVRQFENREPSLTRSVPNKKLIPLNAMEK